MRNWPLLLFRSDFFDADSPIGAKHDFVSIHQHVFITEGTRQPAEGQVEANPLKGSGPDVLCPHRMKISVKADSRVEVFRRSAQSVS